MTFCLGTARPCAGKRSHSTRFDYWRTTAGCGKRKATENHHVLSHDGIYRAPQESAKLAPIRGATTQGGAGRHLWASELALRSVRQERLARQLLLWLAPSSLFVLMVLLMLVMGGFRHTIFLGGRRRKTCHHS